MSVCIIIAKPANGLSIPEAAVVKSSRVNSDGMGIAFAEDGKLSVFHSMTDLEKLMKKLRYAESKNLPVLMHFRIATHGPRDEKNCHPFWVHNRTQVMAHNGVISIPGASREVNDSKLFVKEFVRKLPLTWLEEQDWRNLVAEYIGSSKLAFLSADGKLDILNAGYGQWPGDEYGGAWYSNNSYKTYPLSREVGKGKAASQIFGTGNKAARTIGTSPYWYPLDTEMEWWDWWDELDESDTLDDTVAENEIVCISDGDSLSDADTKALYPFGTVWSVGEGGVMTLNHDRSRALNDGLLTETQSFRTRRETPRWLPATTKYRDVAEDDDEGTEGEGDTSRSSGVSRLHSNGSDVVGWIYKGYTFCKRCLPATAWADMSGDMHKIRSGSYSELCDGCGKGLEDEYFG